MATSVTRNAQFAVNYLKSKGWSDAQSAGIVGNLQAESGVDLNAKAFNAAGGGKGAAGIAQWRGARQTAFEQRYGVPVTQGTLEQQLDYVNWELTQGPEKAAGARLKSQTTAAGAAEVIDTYYERSGGETLKKRVAYAQTLSGGVPEGVIGGAPVEQAPEDARQSAQIYVANVPPIPNRLHDYPTYIYALSLHIMTNEEYNDVVVTQKYTPKNVLIASAGRYSDNFPRNKNFNEDFYFNDFTVTTMIAPNDQSRNTNAIDTKFTIIEPYGFTLVERILKVTEELGGKNYLDMPYLIQIDFFVIDEAGNLVGAVDELQKRFPVKFTKMDVKITERGAEYSISATPFGHTAFDSSVVTVPANMEVTSRTVADFFQSVEGTANDTFAQDIVARATLQQRQEQDAQTAQAQNAPSLLFNSLNQGAAKSTINVDSFGSAINAYYKGLKDAEKIGIADVFRFEFLPDPDTGQDIIGSATFVEEKRNTPKETPMQKNDTTSAVRMRRADIGNSQNIYDPTRAIFSINYGTTIDKLIEYVIRNSSYVQDQLVIPDGVSQEEYQARKEEMKDKPLKWFRIIPKVRILGFDDVRKVWAKEITYTIKPYKMYNVRNDLAPQGIVVSPVKNYNYIFTGKNDDVIDLDIKFNVLYYSQQTAYRNNLTATAPTGDSINTKYEIQNAPNYTGGDPPKGVDYNAVMPLTMKPIVQNSKAVATGNPTTPKEVAASDVADSLMTSSQADMLGVKLRIIGDPDYIKQDDIFYQSKTTTSAAVATAIDPRLLPNGGSLVMDDGGVYVQILFKVPRDIDDQTGFMKYDAGQRNSVFSGLYHVISVTSNFSQGKFIQDLDLVRLPRQVAFDYVGSNNNKSNARPATSTVPGVLGITPDAPVPSLLVSGGGAAPSTADAADTELDQTAGQDQRVAQINNADTEQSTDPQQQDLKAIRNSAPTTNISEQNQTPSIPYPQAPDVPVPTSFGGESQIGSLQREVYYTDQLIESNERQLNSAQQRYDAYIAADPSQSEVRTRLALTTLTRLNNQNSTLLDERAVLEEQIRQARSTN